VVSQARTRVQQLRKLVAWVSRGAIQPGVDGFAMLWLLFRTFLPQVGGLVLMLARRNALCRQTGGAQDDAGGMASGNGGSQSFYLNTFASLQKNLRSRLSAQNRHSPETI
jgi:hypothetical protein